MTESELTASQVMSPLAGDEQRGRHRRARFICSLVSHFGYARSATTAERNRAPYELRRATCFSMGTEIRKRERAPCPAGSEEAAKSKALPGFRIRGETPAWFLIGPCLN